MGLTGEQRTSWDANGFFVLRDSADTATITAMIDRIDRIDRIVRIAREVDGGVARVNGHGALVRRCTCDGGHI